MEELKQQTRISEGITFNIATMAMRFVTPEGCLDCKFVNMSIDRKSKLVVAGELTIRRAVNEHSDIFNEERCTKPLPPIIQGADGCNPRLECGQKRQPEIIGMVLDS